MLGCVSGRRRPLAVGLAEKLGFTTMSLCRYAAGKEDLLEAYPDDESEFGLQRVLDGIEALHGSRVSG